MKTKTIEVLMGLPGSGKTTLAKKMALDGRGTYYRLNREDVIAGFSLPLTYHKQPEIVQYLLNKIMNSMVEVLLSGDKIPILDSMNLSSKRRKKIQGLAQDYADKTFSKVCINYHYLDTPLKECIRRDSLRENPIGKEVITNMHKKFIRNKKGVRSHTRVIEPEYMSSVLG